MACFVVPAAEAIVTTIIAHKVKESEAAEAGPATEGAAPARPSKFTADGRFTWKTRLSWLNGMLWGGAILLLLEHVWHGEVVFYPPFLTAMRSPGETVQMLQEMSTAGVGMAVAITVAWLVVIFVADRSRAVKKALAGQGA